MLRADDIIWVHDYHLIPFAAELRKLGVQNPIVFYLHIPCPPWQTFMAIPEHQDLARALAAYDLIGLQTKADVANLIDYMANGVFGRIVPDGRIRLFDRLVSVASFPIGIDVKDFAKVKRAGGLVQGRPSVSRIIGRPSRLPRACRKFKAPAALENYRSTSDRWCSRRSPRRRRCQRRSLFRHPQQLSRSQARSTAASAELDWCRSYIHRSTPRRRSRHLPLVAHRHGHAAARGGRWRDMWRAGRRGPRRARPVAVRRCGRGLTEALIINPYNVEETGWDPHRPEVRSRST
jgi:trehalose 6-phosphate synthase